MIRASILIVVFLGLAACASMPMGTMLRFSRFDAEALARIDVDEVRARVTLPAEYSLREDCVVLDLAVYELAAEPFDPFPMLVVHSELATTDGGWFGTDREVRRYDFALSEQGKQRLREIQRLVLRANDMGSLQDAPHRTKLAFDFDKVPQQPGSIRVSIELQLDADEGYFTLFDDAAVEIVHHSAPAP